MNFESVPKVENSEFYIDQAFRRAKARYDLIKKTLKLNDPLKKEYILNKERFIKIKESINKDFDRILERFPFYDKLSDFYKELFKCYVDIKKYKKALASVKWAKEKIEELCMNAIKEMKGMQTVKQLRTKRKAVYGRVVSFVNRIEDNLKYLEFVRTQIREFPDIKDDRFKVVITGFPNVGKSTLLRKLTGSKVEVNNYAFTTKQLLTGNLKYRLFKIQVIDAPGTLNREKLNNIEKQAEIAIKHAAELIIYIFDLTEPYLLKKQLELYQRIKKENSKKPIIVYLSKTDIIDKKAIKEFKAKYKIDFFTDLEALKKEIFKTIDSLSKKRKEEIIS
ncbi:MAG: nucleolar GTP-binding protein [Candidatus Woesearchaeota archaeon]|nr:nucleolar GTP-binding protein [Candidatus Woesearchaeota archaeon]